MRLNGWMRLWIVVGVLWAIPVALLGYDSIPKLDQIKNSWVYAATDEIAAHVSETEGQYISGYQIREGLREKYPTDDLAIGWLQQVAAKPQLNQAPYSYRVGKVNQTFQQRITAHPADVRAYMLKAFLLWLIPLLALLALGYATGWIWRGFRPRRNPIN